MAVAVDITLNDDSLLAAPIQGAVVGVFDPLTFAPVAQGTTDTNGKASFLLPGAVSPGTLYELRFFKLGVRFANPAQIQVLEPVVPPATNIFTYSGTIVGSLPAATDPRVCRCTGRFMTYQNTALANTAIRLWHDQTAPSIGAPLIVDGNLVASQSMEFTTDQDGYISVDLLRGGQYRVVWPAHEETVFCITVPDRPSANLIELIYPWPVSLTWDPVAAPANSVSVQVGQSVTVPFTVLFSNFITESKGIGEWVQFTNGDNTLMEVTVGAGVATISGKLPGTAQVTGESLPNLLPSRVPYYNTLVPPLNVTVTP